MFVLKYIFKTLGWKYFKSSLKLPLKKILVDDFDDCFVIINLRRKLMCVTGHADNVTMSIFISPNSKMIRRDWPFPIEIYSVTVHVSCVAYLEGC